MASRITTQAQDAVVLLSGDEYGALLSLLHELQDFSKLSEIAEAHRLHMSTSEMNRIAGLWTALAQKASR